MPTTYTYRIIGRYLDVDPDRHFQVRSYITEEPMTPERIDNWVKETLATRAVHVVTRVTEEVAVTTTIRDTEIVNPAVYHNPELAPLAPPLPADHCEL